MPPMTMNTMASVTMIPWSAVRKLPTTASTVSYLRGFLNSTITEFCGGFCANETSAPERKSVPAKRMASENERNFFVIDFCVQCVLPAQYGLNEADDDNAAQRDENADDRPLRTVFRLFDLALIAARHHIVQPRSNKEDDREKTEDAKESFHILQDDGFQITRGETCVLWKTHTLGFIERSWTP